MREKVFTEASGDIFIYFNAILKNTKLWYSLAFLAWNTMFFCESCIALIAETFIVRQAELFDG